MVANGDDARRYAREVAGQRLRGETEEERATYRRWLRGIIFFYCGLLFVTGIAVATSAGKQHSQMTDLSVQKTMATALVK